MFNFTCSPEEEFEDTKWQS